MVIYYVCITAPIEVGYEMTEYTTSEEDGEIELCVVLINPARAPREFVLSASTRNGSAVDTSDYDAVNGASLVFSRGDNRACHTITINPDDICELEEENEFFFSDLTLERGIQNITIAPYSAEVIIVDDDEPECGKYIGGWTLLLNIRVVMQTKIL